MAKTIRILLHEALLNSKKSVPQISDETSIGTSHLYRVCNPEDENARFPLDFFVPFLKAVNNFEALKHINSLCNFITVSVPQAKLSRKEKGLCTAEFQGQTAVAIQKLIEFFEDASSDKNYTEVDKAMQDVLETIASIKLRIKAEHTGQFELYL